MKHFGGSPLELHADGPLKGLPLRPMISVLPDYDLVITNAGIHADGMNDAQEEEANLGLVKGDLQKARKKNRVVKGISRGGKIIIRYDDQERDVFFTGVDDLDNDLEKEVLNRDVIAYQGVDRGDVRVRGELNRINPPAFTKEEREKYLLNARTPIHNPHIRYPYHAATGTKYITLGMLRMVAQLPDVERDAVVAEINEYTWEPGRAGDTRRRNSAGHLELDSYPPGCMVAGTLDQMLKTLERHYANVKPPEEGSPLWKEQGYTFLSGHNAEVEQLGLCPEFKLRINWVPGGKWRGGTFQYHRAALEHTKGIIDHFLRYHPGIEYVNCGEVFESASKRGYTPGRREVYILQYFRRVTNGVLPGPGLARDKDGLNVWFLRMQDFDTRDYLEKGADVNEASTRADEYFRFNFHCQRFARNMGLPAHDIEHIVFNENYADRTGAALKIRRHGVARPYIDGHSTDKLPAWILDDPALRVRVVGLMGETGAAEMIVGRAEPKLENGHQVRDPPLRFNNGDHYVVFVNNEPRILVGDPTGCCADFQRDFAELRPLFEEKMAPLCDDNPELWNAFREGVVRGYGALRRGYIGTRQERRSEVGLAASNYKTPAGLRYRYSLKPRPDVNWHDVCMDYNQNGFCDRARRLMQRLDETDEEKFSKIWS